MKFEVEGKLLKKVFDSIKAVGNDAGIRVENNSVKIWTVEPSVTAGYIYELDAVTMGQGEAIISYDSVGVIAKFVPSKSSKVTVEVTDSDIIFTTETRRIMVPRILKDVANIVDYEKVKKIVDAVQQDITGKIVYTKSDIKDIVNNATDDLVTFEGSKVRIQVGQTSRSVVEIKAMDVQGDGISGTYSGKWVKPVLSTATGEGLFEFYVNSDGILLVKTYTLGLVVSAVVAPMISESEEVEEGTEE